VAARRKARKRALDVLFEADQRRIPILEVLSSRLETPGTEAPLPEYAVEIVKGVADVLPQLDKAISEASEGWSLDRMPAVDRAVLRIAAWEIGHNPEVETAVAIDEAVELVSDLSTEASSSFVNGVLASIALATPQGLSAEGNDPVE
jgi:N utilization substance protein B